MEKPAPESTSQEPLQFCPPTPSANGQVPAPWYYIFWPPIRWGVYLTYEILREAFLREGKKKRGEMRTKSKEHD